MVGHDAHCYTNLLPALHPLFNIIHLIGVVRFQFVVLVIYIPYKRGRFILSDCKHFV